MTTTQPFDSTVEREMSAGYALFELCEDEDVALADAWEDDDDQLKVADGRLGVESAAKDHRPEIALASWSEEPGAVPDGYSLVGQVEVRWSTDHVELWTSDSDIGDARQLMLPASTSGRYQVRVARTFAPQVVGDLADHLWDHEGLDDHGLERWRFDFWPA